MGVHQPCVIVVRKLFKNLFNGHSLLLRQVGNVGKSLMFLLILVNVVATRVMYIFSQLRLLFNLCQY